MRRITFTMLTVLSLAACRPATTSSSVKESEVLTFARKANALAKTKELAHAFQSLKSETLAPSIGLFDQAEAAGRLLSSWTKGWEGLRVFVDDVDPGTFVTAEDQLTRLLDAQAQTLFEAQSSSTNVTMIGDDLLSRLKAAPRIAYPLGPYQGRYDELAKATNNLEIVIRAVKDRTKAQLDAHAAFGAVLGKRLRLRLRARILQASIDNVNGAIARVDDLFLATEILGPIRDRVTNAYLELDTALANGRYFRGQELIHAMRADCVAAVTAVDTSTVEATRKARYRERIETTCRSMENQAAVFTDASPTQVADFVSEAMRPRQRRLLDACAANPETPGCPALDWLAALSTEDVAAMDMATLAALETALSRAELGMPARKVTQRSSP